MTGLKNLSIEYKSTVIFGIAAIILSLIVGISAGIGPDTVLIRSLILTPIFSGIGFTVIFVIKKFIPEIYELLSSTGSIKDIDVEDTQEKSDEANNTENGLKNVLAEDREKSDDEFSELVESDLPHLTTSPDDMDVSDSINTEEGKLGKHIIKKKKSVKYEPKLMAKAVRTMMLKDGD